MIRQDHVHEDPQAEPRSDRSGSHIRLFPRPLRENELRLFIFYDAPTLPDPMSPSRDQFDQWFTWACGLHTADDAHGSRSRRTDWLAERVGRHERMSRAIPTFNDRCSQQVKLNEVTIGGEPTNEVGCEIPQQLGFTQECLLRQRVPLAGATCDLAVHGEMSSRRDQ